MSMVSGHGWLRPVSSAVTFVTVPDSPDTVIVDGYGEPAELLLMVTGAVFEKCPNAHVGVGLAVAVAVRVGVHVAVAVAIGVVVIDTVAVGVAGERI